MKPLFLLIFLCASFAFGQNDFVGTWKFSSIIYRGQAQPLPNPDLDLRFVFYQKGLSRLKWLRNNEPGFCERIAEYKAEGPILYQKTIWLNPKNNTSCSLDSEMQIPSETYTPFQIVKNQLFLSLYLGDDELIYVFTFLPDEKTGKEITNRVNGL